MFCIPRLALFFVAVCTPGMAQAVEVPASSQVSDSGSATPETRYTQARAYLKKRDVSAALPLLKRLVTERPENLAYAATLAEAYSSIGQYTAAEKLLAPLVKQHPQNSRLWLSWIDLALHEQRWTTALARIKEQSGADPELEYRLAQAYFGLGQVLGKAEIRVIPDGRAGRFVDRWLLVEPRGPKRFLCCPEDSALYQLRRALDAGLDDPAAYLLHARIWRKLGKPKIGFALLKSREAFLLESPDPVVLETFAQLALAADAPAEYLHYWRLRSACDADRQEKLLGQGYTTVAEYYAQRGEVALHREFCRRALRLEPDNAELTLRLADAEWSSDRQAQAALLYSRVLELNPRHSARSHILERLAAWQDQQDP